MASNSADSFGLKIFAAIVVLLIAGIVYFKSEFGWAPPGGLLTQYSPPAANASVATATEEVPTDSTDLSQLVLQAAREHPAPRDSRAGRYIDPYAVGQLALARDEYKQSKALLMMRVSRAAHAAACAVINSVYVSTIEITGMNIIAEQERRTGFPGDHPELFPVLRAIEGKVYAAVKSQPSLCDYWRQNPQVVALMREEAALSN